MKNVRGNGGFAVLEKNGNLQTAAMTLAPGEASGPYGNEHAGSIQVLFLYDGELEAEIDGKTFTMRAGDSVLIAKNAGHRFVNRSQRNAITFNVYSPPAY